LEEKTFMGKDRLFFWICTLLLVTLSSEPSFSQEEEKTYSITLTKTAEIKEDIQVVEGSKVLTETHVIRKGEHLWQILRERGLLQERNLSELLSMLKRLNTSFENLDLMHPGQEIVIPLKIVPIAGSDVPKQALLTPLAALKDQDLENYTVKPGDSISRVVQDRYQIPRQTLYTEYLELVKKLNPSIKDLNTIYPGQHIRIPIFSPSVVRGPIERPQKKVEEENAEDWNMDAVAAGLEAIFSRMGEEWIHTGRHFIPLKSGGQIDLNAESFPVINLRNGHRIIVDLHRKLPEKMTQLIESSWGNYRVAQLSQEDSVRSAFQKVLDLCLYPRVLEKGEPLELGGEIPLNITGDWVILLSEPPSGERPSLAVISIEDPRIITTPRIIKDYLEGIGIRLIEYPLRESPLPTVTGGIKPLAGGENSSSTIQTLLNLAGKSYSTQVEIPVFGSQKEDLKMVVMADFLLDIDGKEGIIDLTGLDQQLILFLKEQNYLVLPLAEENDPLRMVENLLEFIGIQAKPGLHSFTAVLREGPSHVRFTLSGVVFSDSKGDPVLATSNSIPDEIAVFLSEKRYRILPLPS
jgi:LysM repeat protein